MSTAGRGCVRGDKSGSRAIPARMRASFHYNQLLRFIPHIASLLLHPEGGVKCGMKGEEGKVMSICLLFCQQEQGLGALSGMLLVVNAFPKP